MKRLILSRLQPRFVALVRDYLQKHDITQKELARRLEMPEPNLSNLLTQNGRGKYIRDPSAHYLIPFVMRGIFRVDQIYDGMPESKREDWWWDAAKCLENHKLLEKIGRAKSLGLTDSMIENFVDAFIAGTQASKK